MKWISIKEKLPSEDKVILLYSKMSNITVLGHVYKNWSDKYLVGSSSLEGGAAPLDLFTHWMEIPERP